MKRTTWVCPDCNEMRSTSDRVEIREEHRQKPGDGRRHTIKLREVCGACSDKREREMRPQGVKFAPGYDSLFETKGAGVDGQA